jgi:hypothetical protein
VSHLNASTNSSNNSTTNSTVPAHRPGYACHKSETQSTMAGRTTTQQREPPQHWRSSNTRPLSGLRQPTRARRTPPHRRTGHQPDHGGCPKVRCTYACPSPYTTCGISCTSVRIETPPPGVSKGREARKEILPRRRNPWLEGADMANRLQVVQPSVQPNESGSAMIRGTGRLKTRPDTLGTYGPSAAGARGGT